MFGGKLKTVKMTWTIIKITKIDDHQKLSAHLARGGEATVCQNGNSLCSREEVNTHTHTLAQFHLTQNRPVVNSGNKIKIFINLHKR